MRYDLTDLRLFVAIAEEKNLTRGAARAHLAPSSASHRIQRLEEALGTDVFERRARGVTLTKAGELLLRNARQVFASIEQMHADMSSLSAGVPGHVSVWANSHATYTFLPDDLAGFLKKYSQVSISLEEHSSPEIALAVANGEVEVGVLADAEADAQFELIPYRKDRLDLVVPAGHPLTAKARVKFSEVLDYPFVMLHAGSSIHTFTMNAAAAQGKHLNVRIQVRSFGAVCRMVGAGVGIGLVPRSAVPAVALSAPPVIVELDEAWAQCDLQICVRRRASLSGFASALVDALATAGNATPHGATMLEIGDASL